MAKRNYLISGLPGTGKTSVCTELLRRGYRAIDADRLFGYQQKSDWLWDEEKIERALRDTSEEVFICGSASNRDKYMPNFNKVFILYVDDQTLQARLLGRTNNNFGKDPDIIARQLKRNQGVKEYSIKRGRIIIDAARPIGVVVDEILTKSRF